MITIFPSSASIAYGPHSRKRVNLQSSIRTSGKVASGKQKSWLLGMSHPGTAGRGDVERSWRGVDGAGAGTVVNNIGQTSCLKYPRELKE